MEQVETKKDAEVIASWNTFHLCTGGNWLKFTAVDHQAVTKEGSGRS